MGSNDIIQASQAIAARIAAHTLVVHAIAIAILIEQILQMIRIAPARHSLRQTVPESYDHGVLIVRDGLTCCRRTGTARVGGTFFISRRRLGDIRRPVARRGENAN
jgi:hypothetical protein